MHCRAKFHQNGQMLAKILHLAFFDIAAICHNRFFNNFTMNSALVILIKQKFEHMTHLA